MLAELMKYHATIRQPGVLHLFLNASGAPFKSSSFCHYWRELQIRHDANAVMPPRLLRHVFVTSRLENPELPGPSDEGAAMVMGEQPAASCIHTQLVRCAGLSWAIIHGGRWRIVVSKVCGINSCSK